MPQVILLNRDRTPVMYTIGGVLFGLFVIHVLG